MRRHGAQSKCPGRATVLHAGAFPGWLFLPVTRLSSLHYAGPHNFQVQCNGKGEGPPASSPWDLTYLCCAHCCQAAGQAQNDQLQAPHGVCLPLGGPASGSQLFMGLELWEPELAAVCRGSLSPPPVSAPLQTGRSPSGVTGARRQLPFSAGLRLGQGHTRAHTCREGPPFPGPLLPGSLVPTVHLCSVCGSRGRWY